MRDLSTLEAMVRDPDSRPHFHEAVLAFLSGAYRAAVVETWMAVAVDLTNKIRYLAESGDSSAKAAVNSLEIAIKNRALHTCGGSRVSPPPTRSMRSR